MAKPAFIYAFDNLGPYRFVELCGEVFGSLYTGFLLGGEGKDGGIDAEIDKVLGIWRPEEQSALVNQIIQPGQSAIFQFKHKVTARVGQTASRSQLLGLYKCNIKTGKVCELHSDLIKDRKPTAYVLITNVEVNSQFRTTFIEQGKAERPDIQHFQVIGLDELVNWITMMTELRHLYFPTIFGLPRFNLQIKYSSAFPAYNTGVPIPYPDFDDHLLCISVLNIGTVTSYINSIGFEAIVDGERKFYSLIDFGTGFTSHLNSKLGTPLEPGRKQQYYYRFDDLKQEIKTLGKSVVPIGFLIEDEIGNKYYEPISESLSKELS